MGYNECNLSFYCMALTEKNYSRELCVFHTFKLVYVQAGSACWNIGGRLWQIQQGDVVLLNNEEKRVFESVRETLTCIVLEFEPQFLFGSPFSALFLNRKEVGNVVSLPESAPLFCGIMDELRGQKPFFQALAAARLIEILGLAARKIGIKQGEKDLRVSGKMKEAIRYLDENYTSDVSLEQLAQIARLSYSAFSKEFSRCLGIGAMQYLQRKRIEHAVQLLEETDRKVLDIAMECGYNNGASFYKAFKKVTMRSPLDYRLDQKYK